MRHTLFHRLTLLILFYAIGTIVAYPCECVRQSITECYHNSQNVFTGIVAEIKDYVGTDSLYHRKTTVIVLKKWKGEIPDTVVNEFTGSNCDYYFEGGKTYLIFGLFESQLLYTSICTSTKPIENAKEEFEVVEKLSGEKR